MTVLDPDAGGALALRTLLDVLGFTDGEFVATGHDGSGRFATAVMALGHAGDYVSGLPDTANIFFGVNPVRGPARKGGGRGAARDVTRLAALWADLDVKSGGCPDLRTALAIISELSEILGTRPSVITHSGNGLHPYWPISNGTEIEPSDVQMLLDRWKRLVKAVAKSHAAKVDSVFDLARMLRVPNTHNNKMTTNGQPGPLVRTVADAGRALTYGEIDERLNKVGIHTEECDGSSRELVSDPAGWTFSEATCAYVRTLIDGVPADGPLDGGGRHPWAMSQAVRLACARRLGCMSETDAQRAGELLEGRLRELCARTAPRRSVPRYEVPSMLTAGVDIASTKTDVDAWAELGNHSHVSFFATGVGLLVRDLADEVVRRLYCGFDSNNRTFYVYENGLWAPDNDRIDAQVVKLLGNKWRRAHTDNALGVIRHHPDTRAITNDPQPPWINSANGMIDWKTGELRPHSPDYGSTVQLPVEYHPTGTCPAFEKYLTEVLPADCYEPTEDSPEGFIWEVIGYAMYSGNPLHIAIMLHGRGRNGKGALIRVLLNLLGEHNCAAVGLRDLTENRFRPSTLYAKLANLAGDLDSRWIDNTAAFKAITGGDSIQGERKFGHPFEFVPWALPVYSTNKPFGSADSSEGWSDRWIVIPFRRYFSEDERDIHLGDKLATDVELQGIMARGVRALPHLMARGHLLIPASVATAKQQFILASDTVRSWIDECCVIEPDTFTVRPALYDAYRVDTSGDGSKQLGKREFFNRIEQIAGITLHKSDGIYVFRGIRVKSPAERPFPTKARVANG